MILEIANIIRSIGDIRRAIVSLESRKMTVEQLSIKDDISQQANEIEFTTRALNYELTERSEDGES